MDTTTFEESLKRDGFDEVLTRDLEPSVDLDEHTHAWDARAMILAGELTVVTASGRTTCGPGDTFELAAGIPHTEHHGPQGARLLIGRRRV